MSSSSKSEKRTESNATTDDMINLYMSYLKTVRFPLIAAYFEEKGIDISLQELRDLFPAGEVINTPAKKASSGNTCKRIMDDKSKKAGEECGNNAWKTALMCKRCMDLKCGQELANKLAKQLDVDFEIVTGDYDFPKGSDSKPKSSSSSRGGRGRARGASRGAPAARGRGKVSVTKKMNDYNEGESDSSSDNESEDEKKVSSEEPEKSSESEDNEVVEPVKEKKRIIRVRK